MIATIIADLQAVIADIQARDWLALARDFAKLLQDVTSSAGTVPVTHNDIPALKVAIHDCYAEASAGLGGHPILSGLLQAIIAALPTIIAILTGTKPA